MRSQGNTEFHYTTNNNSNNNNNSNSSSCSSSSNKNKSINNTTNNDQSLANHHNDENQKIELKQNHNNNHYTDAADDDDDFMDYKLNAYCTLRSSDRSSASIPKLLLDTNDNSKLDLTKFLTVNRKLKNLIRSKEENSDLSAGRNSSAGIMPKSTLPYSKLRESGEFGSFSISSSSSSSADSGSNNSSTSNGGIINYGLSKDLSTESIKNACDCFDEISDVDDNEVDIQRNQNGNDDQQQNRNISTNTITNQAINKTLLKQINNTKESSTDSNLKRSFPLRFSTLDRRKLMMMKEYFHPYCTIRRDKNNQLQQQQQQQNYHNSSDIINNSNNNGLQRTDHNSSIKSKVNSSNDDDKIISTKTTTMTTMTPTPSTTTMFEDCPRQGSVTSAEAYNILSELDAILNNHLMTTSENVSSSISSSPDSNTADSTTTAKIEDCLLELDAYLEEIDRQNTIDGSNDDDNDDDLYDDTKSICSNKNDKTIPRNIRIQYFQRSKTLPKKTSSTINGNNKKITTTLPSHEETSFMRGQRLRNTIAGLSRNSRLSKMKALNAHQNLNGDDNDDYNCNDDNDHDFDGDNDDEDENSPNKVPSRSKIWRRHSMRKTLLLTLPDQKTKTSIVNHNNNNNNSDGIEKHEENSSESNMKQEPVASSSSPLTFDMVVAESSNHRNNENAFTNEGFQASEEVSQMRSRSSNNNGRRCLSQEDCSSTNENQTQNLTHLDIIHDILRNSSQDSSVQGRPRQFGRRADQHPRIVSIMAETNPLSGNQRIVVNHDRPSSAPAAPTSTTALSSSSLIRNNRNSISSPLTSSNCSRYVGSEPSSPGSSRNPSPVSLLSSTASSSTASAGPDQTTAERISSSNPSSSSSSNNQQNHHIHVPNRSQGNNSQWPHGFSRILALLCCTLGLFNISRFSIMTIHYGGNFLLQFLLLSIIFGIPMLWLQMCLGAKIKSGPVSMWKISPICKGIGISLIIAQCVIALYSTISLGWVMVYFRDSFISRNDFYLWQQPFSIYRRSSNGSIIHNNLTETVADYFNGIVLQRWQLGLGRRGDAGGVRFQLAFNLAIIWTVVFVVLCKGLKSFGKIVLGLTIIPLLLFIVTTFKLLYLIKFSSVQNIFLASDFEDFLINSKTWTAAAQETFFTWTLLGPSVIAISSKSAEKTEGKNILRRDAVLVVIITLFGLSLAAFFGYACVQILQNNDYLYIPGSFEHIDTYTFVYSLHGPISPSLLSVPLKWSPHYSSVLGEAYRRAPISVANAYRESGYQALRLVTELFPATVAVATQEQISSVWSIMTFLMFLLFGIGQLCAMWKPISSALGDSTSSVLLSCVTGLLLGIPFATEMGLSIIHYLDTVLGGAWWILILWAAQILAVFLIRGRPYNGDDLVKDLRMGGSMSAFLALSWNVLLPIGLITLAIIEYKISLASQFFNWRNKDYFHLWTRKVAGFIQISFLMVIPITAIIQIYRYLTNGPPDILDRIQLLYRPLESPSPHRRPPRNNPERNQPTQQTRTVGVTLTNLESATPIHDDAPPKYTPPPSYTTATGARLAKMLRQSIRRSVRRFLGESSHHRPSIPSASHANSMENDSSLPPEYSTVLSNPSGSTDLECGTRSSSQSIARPSSETLSRSARLSGGNNRNRNSPSYTAFDVAQILRPSSSLSSAATTINRNHNHHQREGSTSTITTALDHILRSSSLRYNNHSNKSRSPTDNLVSNAAPLGESNAIVLENTAAVTMNTQERNNSENTSVI